MGKIKTSIEIGATDKTGKATKSAAKNTDKLTDSTKRLATSVKAVASAYGVFAALRFGKDLITGFAALDTAIRKAAAVTGQFAEAFPKFEEAARRMGETTQFTSLQAAESLQKLAQAGLSVQQSLEALPVVLNLSAASGADLATSADIITNIMGGYQIASEDLIRVSDSLTKTFTSSNTSLEELGFAFSFVGGIAKSAGQDFDEINALLGALANNGFKATNGGTALRGAFVRLLRPTTQTQAALDNVGVSVKDSTGAIRPMIDILDDLNKSGADTTELLEIFGAVAGKAMVGLVNQGTDSVRNLAAEIKAADGVTAKTAENMASGLGGTLKLLESQSDEVAKSLGEAFAGEANDSAKIFIEVLRDIKPALVSVASAAASLVGGFIKAVDSFNGFTIGVQAAVLAAKAYALTLAVTAVKSLVLFTKAEIVKTIANKAALKATIANTQSEILRTQSQIRATAAQITNTKVLATKIRLSQQLTILNGQLAASEATLATAMKGGAAATATANLSMKSLLSTTTLFSVALVGLLAFEIGKWARKEFAWVEEVGINVAEMTAKAVLFWDNLTSGFTSGTFFDDIEKIENDFADMRSELTGKSINETQKELDAKKAAAKKEVEEKHKAVQKSVELAQLETKELKAQLEQRQDDFKGGLDLRQEAYERDLRRLEVTETERLNIIENSGGSEVQLERDKNQLKRDIADETLDLARIITDENIAESNRLYDEQIRVWQGLNRDTSVLERQKTEERKKFLLEYETAYESTINDLIGLEKKLSDKARAARKAVIDDQASFNERLRSLNEIGLNDEQLIESRKQELARLTSERKQALRAGDLSKAEEISKKEIDLQLEIARATKEAATEENATTEAAQQSAVEVRKLNQLQKERQSLLSKVAIESEKEATNAGKAVDARKAELAALSEDIKKINTELAGIATEKEVAVNVDDKEWQDFKKDVDQTQLTKTVTVKTAAEKVQRFAKGYIPEKVKYFAGGFIPKGRDTMPAMIDPQEAVITRAATARVSPEMLGGLNAGLSPVQAISNAGGKVKDTFALNLNMSNGETMPVIADDTNENRAFIDMLKRSKVLEG